MLKDKELWLSVPGWEGFYQVSSLGQVRSVTRGLLTGTSLRQYQGRILKPSFSSGYALVNFVNTHEGLRKSYYVHDLVLLVFVGPKPVGLEVCHGPLGPHNNALANIRYDTRKANSQDRKCFGEPWPKKGFKSDTRVQCVICGVECYVKKRRRAKHHLCKTTECRSAWGKICHSKRTRL